MLFVVLCLVELCHDAGLQQIVTNFSKTAENLTGPVAIVAVGSEIARSDLSGLFQFAAIVNINLAVVNALPLPALDGGFLALLLAEAVRGTGCCFFCKDVCHSSSAGTVQCMMG